MTSRELSAIASFKALHEICAWYRKPFSIDISIVCRSRANAPERNHFAQLDRMSLCRSNGFTMVEVLISVFVLAIGIIGSAGMQLTALRTAQQSTFQTTALQLASEMADKMRVNYRQMKLSDNANLFLDVDYRSTADAAVTAPGVMCYEVSCTAEDLAKFDIHELQTRIKALPGGRVRICRDANPWDNTAGTFKWSCSVPETSASNAPLVIKIGWEGKGNSPDGRTLKDAGKQFPPSVAITVEPYAK